MPLRWVRWRQFRNLADGELDVPAAGWLVLGANGQGKTNLLEAFYYLAVFRSFRGARDEELVRFGADWFRLEAEVVTADGPRRVAVAYDRPSRRKRVTLDGADPPRLSDAVGVLAAVPLLPSDLQLVAGPPTLRRGFLDVMLSLAYPLYLRALQRYRHALEQRNAALRRRAGDAAVAVWDEPLAEAGAWVLRQRYRWAQAAQPPFDAHMRQLTDGLGGRLRYAPTLPPPEDVDDLEAWRAALRVALAARRAEERHRGFTVVGPHRDDLRLEAEIAPDQWIDLHTFGSTGQQRTAAIALRLTEAETVRQARRQAPLLLFDDAGAELDAERLRRLLAWAEAGAAVGHAQPVYAAPKDADLPYRPPWPCHRLRAGHLHPCEGDAAFA